MNAHDQDHLEKRLDLSKEKKRWQKFNKKKRNFKKNFQNFFQNFFSNFSALQKWIGYCVCLKQISHRFCIGGWLTHRFCKCTFPNRRPVSLNWAGRLWMRTSLDAGKTSKYYLQRRRRTVRSFRSYTSIIKFVFSRQHTRLHVQMDQHLFVEKGQSVSRLPHDVTDFLFLKFLLH